MNDHILCFRHCSSLSVFCKTVPEICPICNKLMVDFVCGPFELPYPLMNGIQNPVSIVVRPSERDFLEGYHIYDDLHIGIVNADGQVIEFDKRGLVMNDFAKWTNCLVIKLVPDSWESHWDQVLKEVCDNEIWNSNNYNDVTLNCFNFVITFLNELKYNNTQFLSKEEMCQTFILPKIQNILKYSCIYNKLKDQDYYIQN